MAPTIKRSVVAVMATLFWLLALILPSIAFAQDSDSGTQGEGGLAVSAEGDAAYEQGASFALQDFSRAQVGSSAPVGGKDYGYHFLVGADPLRISSFQVSLKGLPSASESSGSSFSKVSDRTFFFNWHSHTTNTFQPCS